MCSTLPNGMPQKGYYHHRTTPVSGAATSLATIAVGSGGSTGAGNVNKKTLFVDGGIFFIPAKKGQVKW